MNLIKTKLKEIRQYNVVFVVWAVAFLWRIFFWGLYSDDWTFSCKHIELNHSIRATFLYFINANANRPVLSIFTNLYFHLFYFTQSLIVLQVCSVLIILFTALSIYHCTLSIAGLLGIKNKSIVANLASVFWMIAPFHVGLLGFHASLHNLLAVIFFTFSLNCFIGNWGKNSKEILRPMVYLMLSYLTYEAFYFQFVLFLAIFFGFRFHQKYSASYKVKLYSFFILIQVSSIFYNRLSVYIFSSAVHKKMNLSISTFAVNFTNLPYTIMQSANEIKWILLSVFVFIAVLFFGRLKLLVNSKDKSMYFLLLMLLLGFPIALFVYSIPGVYGLNSIGIDGKIFLALSFFLSVCLALAYSILYDQYNRKLVNLSFILLGICFFIGAFYRNMEWVNAWTIQKKVVAKWDASRISSKSEKILVIYDGPITTNPDVPIFNDDWSVNVALMYGKELLWGGKQVVRPSTYIVGPILELVHPFKPKQIGHVDYTFHNDTLTRHLYTIKETFLAKEVYVWHFETNKIEKMENGTTISLRTEPKDFIFISAVIFSLPQSWQDYLNKKIFSRFGSPI